MFVKKILKCDSNQNIGKVIVLLLLEYFYKIEKLTKKLNFIIYLKKNKKHVYI